MYQFLAMPFGLGTAPLVGKEFKGIATSLQIRLNQYLDDWLNQAPLFTKNNPVSQSCNLPRFFAKFCEITVYPYTKISVSGGDVLHAKNDRKYFFETKTDQGWRGSGCPFKQS